MNVKPVLGDWEIPRIEFIQSLEQRSFVEFKIPARSGNLFQDMNVNPTRIKISGSLQGDELRNSFLEEVRGKFREGEPLTFVGDIVTATEVQYVIIETLEIEESGLRPDELSYSMVLKESPPPPPPSNLLGDLDTSLLDDAAGLLDSAMGALDVIGGLGDIPDFGNPVPQVGSVLDDASAMTDGISDAVNNLNTLFGID